MKSSKVMTMMVMMMVVVMMMKMMMHKLSAYSHVCKIVKSFFGGLEALTTYLNV